MIPFWWACCTAWQTGTNSSSRSRGVRRLSSQYVGDRHALDQLHDEVRPAGRRSPRRRGPWRCWGGPSAPGPAARPRTGRSPACVSIPGLMTFSATLRRTGCGLLGHEDDAHTRPRRSAPAACTARSTVPGRLGRRQVVDGRRRGAAPAAPGSCRPASWAASRASTSAAEAGVAGAGPVQVAPAAARRAVPAAASKNTSFARGSRSVMARVRSVATALTVLSARNGGGLRAKRCRGGRRRLRRARRQQPGAGEGPEAVGGAGGDAQGVGRPPGAVRPAKKRSLTSRAAAGSSAARAGSAPRRGRAGRRSGSRRRRGRSVEVDPHAGRRRACRPACGGPGRRGCGAWPRRRRRRSGRGRSSPAAASARPAGGTPRGPGRWPGGSGPASRRPAAAAASLRSSS